MAFDPDRLRAHAFPLTRQAYGARDAILYALGVGLPFGAVTEDLTYLLEDRLTVLPTFAVTLATPGMWVKAPELELNWVKLLHSAQAAEFHTPLPAQAEVVSHTCVKSLHDRGAGKGSICVIERRIVDAVNDTLYCTVNQTLMLRGNDGFGSEPAPRVAPPTPPDRAPDHSESVQISPRAALVYRLSGDVNPLHADPEVARKAGFDRPILHGLASYGTMGALVLRRFCGHDPARLAALSLRFAGVVYPGDRLDCDFWQKDDQVLFTARVGDRVVLDQGLARLA
ncbi:MaoC/PaaZ C-terminal domain-containing protein [Pontitalea aquivivens]|uniref:MaoC/PaaZ C-terminal domain-containing protein n=1 Tax=Pontitalea aquivivens TaxID=3388663 RepID=UPI0039710C2A